MRVLIADDEGVARRVAEKALEGMGHEVVAVCDGAEAWALLEREPFDVLISDWMMPEMDGIELCRRVRAREEAPFCYVMLVTRRSKTDDVVRGIMGGADDFMSKPFDRAELRARLHAAERVVSLERSLVAKVHDLERAIDEVRTLRRLLPICVYCKSIRNDQEMWNEVEEYMREHAQTEFTHSICPTCYEDEVQPMLDEMRRDKAAG